MITKRSIPRRMPLKMPVRLQSTSADAPVSTFQFQDQSPHLPVPSLEETARRYLKTIRPLVLDEQYKKTEATVKEFIKPGGVGETSQKRLQERATKHKNWIYEWWNDAAYLTYRDPIVPYVSYFYSYKDHLAEFPHAAGRAAAIVTAALEFKTSLETEKSQPDYMRKKPIDMESFNFSFNTCRSPEPVRDGTASYPSKGNEHIIVIRRNRFYKSPYVNPKTGEQLTTEEIEQKSRGIYADAESKGTGPNIGVLTSENRDKWTEARKRLVGASRKNAVSLEAIQSAAFVVCLDWASPETALERTHQYWHGHGINRFYDKPAQFIINDNGTAGFMGEHSMMDGTQTSRLNEYVLDGSFNKKINLTKGVSIDTEKTEESPFEVNAAVAKDIAEAEIDFKTEIDKHEVAIWRFEKYGKNLIKQFKTSPDAYMQMSSQLAYYRMNGRVRPVYESATTRKYIQGRTETTRSVSTESADLCKKFWDSSVADAAKISAFRDAINAQVAYVADATEGFGVDRHLFGLKKSLLPGEPVPEIYQDPVFPYSSSWYISSSQLSSEYLNGYGWSQVIPEGFGCAYMINKNDSHVNICSQYMGSHRFKEYLEEAATKLAQFLSTEGPKSKL